MPSRDVLARAGVLLAILVAAGAVLAGGSLAVRNAGSLGSLLPHPPGAPVSRATFAFRARPP